MTAAGARTAPDGMLRLRAYELYYLALADRQVSVEATPRAGSDARPDSDRTLRVPADPPPAGRVDPRTWHRVALAHRALHHELGTFGFSLAAADERVRAGLRPVAEGRSEAEAVLRGFADRNLAIRIFATLEGLRLDAALPRRFPGLAGALAAMLGAAAASRPDLRTLAPRTAAVEVLVRCSLGHPPVAVPEPIAAASAALEHLCRPLAEPGATVADTVLATGLAYAAVVRLPNLGVLTDAPELPVREAVPAPAGWPTPWPEPTREAIEGDAILDVSVPPVPHRDDVTHRLWHSPEPPAPSEQAVYTWRAEDAVDADAATTAAAVEVSGPPEPLPHEHHDITRDVHHHEHGPLDRTGPHTFVYPEWDSVRGTALPGWCRVAEEAAAQADPAAVHDLQRHHQLLVARLRRLMQSAAPRALDVQRRTADGDDIDFDAAVDALVDLRAGRSPHDGVYQRLVPQRRDVVVGLLVDASSSTGERLEQVPPLAPVTHPVGYRDHPRVLDLEILATVLCLTAIDAVGDASVAWAFSGTGREAVRLSVVKTLHEPFSGRVLRRAAAVKPGHATRTGAAIRHAAAVLAAAAHTTRLLLVLTDGQPFDVDYGQQYGEEQAAGYARADTARAVADAARAGVRTVQLVLSDRSGDQAPPGDTGTETLSDITLLPQRLTSLYRNLTTSAQPAVRRPRTATNQ